MARASSSRRGISWFASLTALAAACASERTPAALAGRPAFSQSTASAPPAAPPHLRAREADAGSVTPALTAEPQAPQPTAPEPQAPEPTVPEAPRGTTELPVEGFLPAIVSWPGAERWPQPLLIAAHGAGGFAEVHCEFWRELLGARGTVLCLRGKAIAKRAPRRGFYFPDHLALEREAVAALAALAEQHGPLVDASRSIYAGYSQGAQMGLLMLAGRGREVPRLLLVEGGSGDWTTPRVRRFKESGGERVALVCGTPRCHQRALESAARLTSAGIENEVHYAPGAGHTFLGPVVPKLEAAFATLTAGDERWQ